MNTTLTQILPTLQGQELIRLSHSKCTSLSIWALITPPPPSPHHTTIVYTLPYSEERIMAALMFTYTISFHSPLWMLAHSAPPPFQAAARGSAWPPHNFEVDGVLLPYRSGYAAPSNVNGSFTAINAHELHQHVCLLLSIFKSSYYMVIQRRWV